ncbi:DUF3954 domain-containing protein [Gracilibacillus sp. S3-1-1]|uniref:DUF3954 domain-containing protein n=1 Tax=Gracilibacillus pellucidus TaxID=3095368 RepID=A0ACC6M3G2_9BACI|nr:DUF3954 domain-containing protein [Gracilibacillus sp. S3-1-1]MDX8045436.1 DUF3954 domain-containing protein [Gracilibacillus sp. S3-1-1]
MSEDNAVYMVKDGVKTKVDTPPHGFGKQVITWQDGKPILYEINYTVKTK